MSHRHLFRIDLNHIVDGRAVRIRVRKQSGIGHDDARLRDGCDVGGQCCWDVGNADVKSVGTGCCSTTARNASKVGSLCERAAGQSLGQAAAVVREGRAGDHRSIGVQQFQKRVERAAGGRCHGDCASGRKFDSIEVNIGSTNACVTQKLCGAEHRSGEQCSQTDCGCRGTVTLL